MRNTELWLREGVETDGQIALAATLERPDGSRSELWYRLPTELEPAITQSADPFVTGILFDTMHTGGRLLVHGEVSPSLLRNLEEFQWAWTKWRPERYRKVEIVPDRECEASPAETTAAVTTFSGGLDSCFTAWRHYARLAGPQQRDLRAGLFVHGFDIPLSRQGDHSAAAEQAERLLASVGMDCLRVATNFRELRGPWEDTHGAALASCLMLLQNGYRFGLVASSYAYSQLHLPYGSNPLTDGMFSSAAFTVIHDGAGFTRLEKTRVVAQWPEVPKYLRVCWRGPQYDRNCCRCQKCIRNILYFRMVGLSHMECFDRDLTDREIIWAAYPCLSDIEDTQRILQAAQEANVAESWVRALKISIRLNQLRMKMPRSARAACLALRKRLGRQPLQTAETTATSEESRPVGGDKVMEFEGSRARTRV